MEKVMWKIDGIIRADAQKVYEEMGDSNITPEELLEKAKNEKSELHKCFDWDDKVAAHKYRLIQAQTIIRLLVKVPESEEEHPVRVFQISSEKHVYQPTVFFQRDEDEYQKLLSRALVELEGFKKRYSMLSELETIMEDIDKIQQGKKP